MGYGPQGWIGLLLEDLREETRRVPPLNLRKHRDVWRASVYMGTINGKDKRRTQVLHYPQTREGKKAATKAAHEWAATLEQPTIGTVADLLDQWQTARSSSWSLKHRTNTAQWVTAKILPELGATLLGDLTPQRLEQHYNHLLDRGSATGGPLSPSSVGRVHTIIRTAFNAGIGWGLCTVNPALAAKPPKIRRQEIRPPSVGQIEQAAQACTSDPWSLYLRLAFRTGVRRSEALGLRWTDIDLPDRRITINQGVTAADGQLEIKAPKSGEPRTVAIDGDTADRFKLWADTQALECDTPAVYVFARGTNPALPMHPDSVRNWWRRLTHSVPSLEGVRLHDLRHFAATQMLGNGVPIQIVAHRLGHRDTSTTLRIYAHFMPELDREAADKMGAIGTQ